MSKCPCSRRDFLVRGMYGIGVGGMLPLLLSRTSAALSAQALQGTSVEQHPNRILVVIELSGGNDGLNTVVPFGTQVMPLSLTTNPRARSASGSIPTFAPGRT